MALKQHMETLQHQSGISGIHVLQVRGINTNHTKLNYTMFINLTTNSRSVTLRSRLTSMAYKRLQLYSKTAMSWLQIYRCSQYRDQSILVWCGQYTFSRDGPRDRQIHLDKLTKIPFRAYPID